MEDKKRLNPLRRMPVGVLAGLATVVVASGGAAAWFTWQSLSPTKLPTADFPNPTLPSEGTSTSEPVEAPPAAQQPVKEPTEAPAAEVSGQVYWVKDVDGRLSLAPEPVSLSGSTADQQLASAFEALLSKSGNPSQDAVTTIPEKTQLLSVTSEADGVHIDLSQEFTSGGGSTSMIGRLGQVVYTATALDPQADVWISVQGKPLTLLGGEGIEVSQPMTREDVKEAFDL
ncbi:MAG TPA: GerMN domain-containing protein [Trichocoleus sp.]